MDAQELIERALNLGFIDEESALELAELGLAELTHTLDRAEAYALSLEP